MGNMRVKGSRGPLSISWHQSNLVRIGSRRVGISISSHRKLATFIPSTIEHFEPSSNHFSLIKHGGYHVRPLIETTRPNANIWQKRYSAEGGPTGGIGRGLSSAHAAPLAHIAIGGHEDNQTLLSSFPYNRHRFPGRHGQSSKSGSHQLVPFPHRRSTPNRWPPR